MSVQNTLKKQKWIQLLYIGPRDSEFNIYKVYIYIDVYI